MNYFYDFQEKKFLLLLGSLLENMDEFQGFWGTVKIFTMY